MRVLAIHPGFYAGSRKRPGAVFEMPDAEAEGLLKSKHSWIEPAPATAAEAAARAASVEKAERTKIARGAVDASATAAANAKKAEHDNLV